METVASPSGREFNDVRAYLYEGYCLSMEQIKEPENKRINKYMNELIQIRFLLKEKKEYIIADRIRNLIEELWGVKISDNKNSVSLFPK